MKKIALSALLALFAVSASAGQNYISAEFGPATIVNSNGLSTPYAFRVASGKYDVKGESGFSLGTEASYAYISSAKRSDSFGTFGLTSNVFGGSVVGGYAIPSTGLSVTGNFGVNFIYGTLAATGGYASTAESGFNTTMSYGLGVSYKINEKVGLTANYRNFGKVKTGTVVVNSEVTATTVGLDYSF